MPREDLEYCMSQIRQWQRQYEKFLASGSPSDMPEMPPPFSDEALALAARLRSRALVSLVNTHGRTLLSSTNAGAWIAVAATALLAATLLSEPRSPDVKQVGHIAPQTTEDQTALKPSKRDEDLRSIECQ